MKRLAEVYLYNACGFFALYIKDVKPIACIGACTWLRTQRT
jgi:hypothetical protein